MIYDFNECYAFAERRSPELDNLYINIFRPISIEVVYDIQRQKLGIDKILHTPDGEINIDEKIERNNTNNIVFEGGWLNEKAETDYVVVYKTVGKRVFIIPYDVMLNMYKELHKDWANTPYEKTITNDYGGRIVSTKIYVIPYTKIVQYMEKKGYDSDKFKYVELI